MALPVNGSTHSSALQIMFILHALMITTRFLRYFTENLTNTFSDRLADIVIVKELMPRGMELSMGSQG